MEIHKLKPFGTYHKRPYKSTQTPSAYPPTVNWHRATAYKLSKSFTQSINQLTPLPYSFNIKSTTQITQNLKETPILPIYKFASLDISNMYSNIPIRETRQILEDITEHNLINPQTKTKLLNWYDIIKKQNYFNNIIIQNNGLAMGVPSFSILADVFLQHAENSHIAYLAQKQRIINYFQYVDDIFLIFDPNHTDMQVILTDFNSLHPNLCFTAEIEQNNTIH
jgi:hypothetical protein